MVAGKKVEGGEGGGAVLKNANTFLFWNYNIVTLSPHPSPSPILPIIKDIAVLGQKQFRKNMIPLLWYNINIIII